MHAKDVEMPSLTVQTNGNEAQPLLPTHLSPFARHSPGRHNEPLAISDPHAFLEDIEGSGKDYQPLLEPRPIGSATESPVTLGEAHASVKVPSMDAPWWQKMWAFAGVGCLISVGYMDPGNWSTDLVGGSKFGYLLLCVVLFSSLMAMFLQHLALKLGVVMEKDLAQACRDVYPRKVNLCFWILAEVAIAACDLAEVIGSAIALNLLLGIPTWVGVLLTALDVLVLLVLTGRHFRVLELVVACLTGTIALCFVLELARVKPNWLDVVQGLIPSREVFTNRDALYISVGIVGATVMPHNLYLHSSVVQTRAYQRNPQGKAFAVRYATLDSVLSLSFAFFINAAILVLAAAAFYYNTHQVVDDISQAYNLLAPTLGAKAASILFGVALLASGQSSTITGTLAGQIVMEGFLDMKLQPWLRRMVTRLVAIVPAVVVAATMGSAGLTDLLILSQVILSFQLSFAVVPMVHFTGSAAHMGRQFANHWVVSVVAWTMAVIIAGLNVYLIVQALVPGGQGALLGGK